ncbi:site-specific integrase [Wohlfahrtiimonas chitiniclastica]|uniref:tyrosine-type recombinase/integrase n=1 Tax=Wohlfahrtiimonas chitiniclastica TaxID=400946 RepID=UPI001BCE582A|nr:site-specific integrase [Wohlfahrtiimonas chitiniclastica]MBS7826030.1 site-specific integrase [Wohlfahrtiimonas chitiniclastica]
MGSVTKRGKRYLARAQYTRNYIKETKSRSFNSHLDALMWIEKTEKSLRLGKSQAIDTTKKVKDAVIRYRDEVSPTKKSKEYEINRLNYFLKMKSFPSEVPLHTLITRDIATWRNSRNISNSSKNREISLLSAVFEVARIEWNWMEKNPTRDLKRLTPPPPRNRRISDFEIKLLLDNLEFADQPPTMQKHKVGLIFLLALETAMRQSEIATLDWSQVSLRERSVTLLATKNGDRRQVPLSSRARELFELMNPKSHGNIFNITADTVCTTFRKAVKECNIIDLTFHDSRHEACTRLAQKLAVLDLAKTIGHRDTKSLMIYYNPTIAELADRLG